MEMSAKCQKRTFEVPLPLIAGVFLYGGSDTYALRLDAQSELKVKYFYRSV